MAFQECFGWKRVLAPNRFEWNAAGPTLTVSEQVAAKVTRTDENGSWILAVVQRYYADTDTYDVQDEDDTSKLIRLPWTHVMRLSTGSEGIHKRGAYKQSSVSGFAVRTQEMRTPVRCGYLFLTLGLHRFVSLLCSFRN